jgi:hypothetical protein
MGVRADPNLLWAKDSDAFGDEEYSSHCCNFWANQSQ